MDSFTQEDDLIRLARSGNPGAFSELVGAHQGALRAFTARFAPDLETADEVAQETFLRAYQGLARFELGTDFAKWLRGIARHVLQDSLRRRAREAGVRQRAADAFLAESMARRVASAEEGDDTDFRLRALLRCVEELDEGPRELLGRRYREGLSTIELAGKLGRGVSAIRVHLLKIRRMLRACIELRLRKSTV